VHLPDPGQGFDRVAELWLWEPIFQSRTEARTVAKPELGAKRICPETGRKFYDLNRDPIVSPYTGKSYPRSYFESGSPLIEEDEELEEKELDSEEAGVEMVSLEEADEEVKAGDELADVDDEDVDLGDDDDAFLPDEDDEDEDVSGIIDVDDDDEDL
jgi:uncharacterized protein (TIGR02300 family)